jgi:hypothetical protein
MISELRETYEKELASHKLVRSNFEGDWKLLQSFMPFRGRFFLSETNQSQKSRINGAINNAGIMAVRTLRSGLMAGVTSPARQWFRLATQDADKMKSRRVKEYLEIVEMLMRDIFSRSNLYQVLPYVYGELGNFGTACLVAMPSFNNVVNYFPVTIGQYYLGTNDENRVDTMVREFTLTGAQAMQKFNGNVSSRIKSAYDRGDTKTLFTFCHTIKPNPDALANPRAGKEMDYISVYWEQGNDTNKVEVSRMSGFGSFNVFAPRWETTGEDVYGYGCGHYAFGDDKQLQIQEKRKGQAIDKMVSPPMKAPSTMKQQPIVGIPGGVTYYDSNSPGAAQGLSPLYEVRPAIQELSIDMARVEQRISRAFYEDLFLMMAQSDRRQITAREIDERAEEKLLQLGPAMESMHNELLDPIISNCYYHIQRAGLLPDAPEELEGESLQIEYISVMAQAQKMVGIGAIERFIGFVGLVGQQFPEARHKVDAINAVDTVGDMLGVPQKILRPQEEVDKSLQADAQQANMQQAAQMGMAGTEAAKTLSEANTSRGNLLETLAGV